MMRFLKLKITYWTLRGRNKKVLLKKKTVSTFAHLNDTEAGWVVWNSLYIIYIDFLYDSVTSKTDKKVFV